MEQEVDSSSISVKEEPKEEFSAFHQPPAAEDSSAPQLEEEIKPEWIEADVKDEPPGDYDLTLPPATNDIHVYKCDKCPFETRNERKLARHEMIYGGSFKYKRSAKSSAECPHCRRLLKQKSNLTRHLRTCPILNPDGFQCDFCGEKFLMKRERTQHMLKHSSEKPFRCSECGVAFETSNKLRKHSSSTWIHSCVICDLKFSCKPLLDRHRIECHGVDFMCDVFKCDKCPYQTKIGGNFMKHKGFHDKSISCETCQKKFALKQSLKNHQMQHWHGSYANVPKETFNCDECGKLFSNQTYLKIHQRHVHVEINVKCDICDKICRNRHSLVTHRQDHEKAECPICKSIIRKRTLASHLQRHSSKKLFKSDRLTKAKRQLKKRQTGFSNLDKPNHQLRKKSTKSCQKNLPSIKVDNAHMPRPKDAVEQLTEAQEEPQMEHFLLLKPKWVKSATLAKFDAKWHIKSKMFQTFFACPHCQLVMKFQLELTQHLRTCNQPDSNVSVKQEW